jgi:hypothetical protein
MYGDSSMATQGGQEPQWRTERQGSGLREERRSQSETASTRGRIKARLFLCEDEWYEEEVDLRKDC